MKKVVVYIAMSLDGYIADPKGGVSFLGGDGSDADNFGSYPAFIETIDTVILGYHTYHQIVTELSPDAWAYAGKKSYVLTHKALENTDEVIFTCGEICQLVEGLKQQAGKDIWICGGASIINQLHQKNLIDRYHITVIPTILGDGIRLFDQTDKQVKLQLQSTSAYNGIVDLVYEKRA